jgi:hypothetical protein
MYPSPVPFRAVAPGPRGVRLTWASVTEHELHSYVVFRSPRPIGADDTERFYARLLDFPVRQERLHPHVLAWEDAPLQPIDGVAYYVVLASTQRGDLVVVPFDASAIEAPTGARAPEPLAPEPSLLPPPELVFREDDPMALVRTDSLAQALSTLGDRAR